MQLSVICPFYNEENIIANAMRGMLDYLDTLHLDWELIVVNDGSTDDSPMLAREIAERHPRARLISYAVNKGRGHALRAGIAGARGDILVTTEIDRSWGDSIILELYQALRDHPKKSFVIASPNLPGGGYKDVPGKRIRISRLGNLILRAFFSFRFTMHTGMTRAYRREAIQDLSFRENGKEFHLESLLKLVALGHEGMEIPAVLQWKDKQLAADHTKARKSSSKIPRLIVSHLRFAIMANPIRYFWAVAVGSLFLGIAGLGIGFARLLLGYVAINFLLLGVLMLVFGAVFFGFGIVAAQNRTIMEELWLIRRQQRKEIEDKAPPNEEGAS
jgi:glycosyltransferase involved in cell wall biosynthesis